MHVTVTLNSLFVKRCRVVVQQLKKKTRSGNLRFESCETVPLSSLFFPRGAAIGEQQYCEQEMCDLPAQTAESTHT